MIASRFTIDDTYYYLQSSWNLKETGEVTFDRINVTNGVQFLWFSIISLIALFAKTKILFLLFVLILCFILNALVHIVIWKISSLFDTHMFSLLLSVLWFREVISTHRFYSGMENSLHALFISLIIYYFLKVIRAIRRDEKAPYTKLTLLLVFNVWTRLDAIILSLIFFIYPIIYSVYRKSPDREKIKKDLRLVPGNLFLFILGISFQLLIYKMMAGSFIPVSAMIKSAGKSFHIHSNIFSLFLKNLSVSFRFPEYTLSLFMIIVFISSLCLLFFTKIRPMDHGQKKGYSTRAIILFFFIFFLVYILGFMFIELGLKVALIFIIVLILGRNVFNIDYLTNYPELNSLISAAAVYSFLYHMYISGTKMSYQQYFFWYRAPFILIGSILIGYFILTLIKLIPGSASGNTRYFLVMILMAAIIVSGFNKISSGYEYHPMLNAQYRTAKWLKRNIPDDSVIASWNAGQVAWFSGLKVVNLDGLINSPAYFREKNSSGFRMIEYLKRMRVDYVVDYCCVRKNGLMPHLIPVHSVNTLEGWKPIIVWKVVY